MAPLKLFVFGPPRLEHNDQPIDLNLRKAMALFIYLAVTGQPQSRDTLATLLWPDSGQREGRARLRRTLHRLREAVGDEVVAVAAETIRIHPHADLWVDSAAFQQHIAVGLRSSSSEEEMPPDHLDHLTAAVQLYGDDFLAGFTLPDCPAFDEWQFFERERLRQTLAQVLACLVQVHQRQGAWETAIQYARRQLALDPLDEAVHRQLMQLYAWAGQQAAALRQYWECVRILDAELGIPPDDETKALFMTIKAKRLPQPSIHSQGRARSEELTERDVGPSIVGTSARQQIPQAAALPQPVSIIDSTPTHRRTAANVTEQQIRFCTSPDGVRIAYATVGAGPPLVKAANWLSHLEFDWNSPVWRHWLIGLSRDHTLVRYDERGCGLSDWDVNDFSLEAWVQDLEMVVNALGLERFPLLGLSQGGPVAIAYAVRHPEKVSHLILYGSYVCGRLKLNPTPEQLEEVEIQLKLMKIGWGRGNPAFRQVFTTLFMPEATAEQTHWFNDLQQISTSPENAIKFRTTFSQLDVRDLAPRVTTPTLVLHARNDALESFEEGRQLAALIPGARFVPLESKNHILLESEPAWPQFLAEVHHFLTGETTEHGRAPHSLPSNLPSGPPSTIEAENPVPVGYAIDHQVLLERPESDRNERPTVHHLPAQLTPFIGRERELSGIISHLYDPTCRLLTLVGPGGIGKTRLALEVVQTLKRDLSKVGHFAHGILFVPLAAVNAASGIMSAIAEAAGFNFFNSVPPREQLLDYLREKRMLLVLDNFEHLLPSASSPNKEQDDAINLILDILTAAPAVKILVTSREGLNLQEEWFYPLIGLPFPGRDAEPGIPVERYDAVRLFEQCARRIQDGFSLENERAHVVRVCRLVEGMPLAIELAAAWLKVLTTKEVAQEIEHNLDILTTRYRNVPERHRSMRIVLEQSWALLGKDERETLHRLSIFQGGFRQTAAMRVARASRLALASLVEKSLLRMDVTGRYQIHGLLRQFAGEKLQQDPDEEHATHERHSDYYLAFLNARESALIGKEQQAALVAIDEEIDNIRVAWYWAVEHDQLEMIEQTYKTLYRYYQIRSRYHEGAELFAWAADHLRRSRVRHPRLEHILGKVTARWAALRSFLGDYETASEQLHESLGVARRLGDQRETAFALNILGQVAGWQGKDADAKQLLHESLTLSREIGDKTTTVNVLERLAQIYVHLGEYVDGKRLAEESLTLSRELGRPDWIAHALDTLGWATFCLGEYQQSDEYYRESLTIFESIGDQNGIALAAGGLGLIASVAGGTKAAEALAYLEHVLAISREIGHRLHVSSRLFILGMLANSIGEYARARQYCEEGLAIARELGSPIFMGYNLGLLGAALCELGELQTSRKCLVEAIQMAWQAGLPSQLLGALLSFAALLIREGELAGAFRTARVHKQGLAMELLTLVIHHPKSRQDLKDRAHRLLDRLESELPAEVMATAQAHGARRSIDEVMAEILGSGGSALKPVLHRASSEQITKPDPDVLLPSMGVTPESQVVHDVPVQLTPFVGREQELTALKQLLLDEPMCRLVTVLGPGGIGKTRLALAAASVQDAFQHGVYFVSLAPLTSADHIVSTLAEEIGFRFYEGGEPKQQLLDYLREKHMLLVLDNFEHVLVGAELVTDILQTAPRVHLLVTSRERLNLSGEVVYTLGEMAFPQSGSDQKVLEYGAVQLLMYQARLVRPDLDMRTYNLDAIVRICRLVQGMPLALVLAASWVDMLSFNEIADEIARSLDFLESEWRDLPERHRSIRAVFQSSWHRLTPDEQQVFARLSVFRGGFTREAAQAVAGANLSVLRRLVSASFLSTTRDYRYEMHELLRQFGAERLSNAEQVAERHSTYYKDYIARHAPDLLSGRQREAMEAIANDLENIRVAWRRAIAQGDIQAVGVMAHPLLLFHDIRSRYVEGFQEMDLALEMLEGSDASDDSTAARVAVLAAYGFMAMRVGKIEQAREAFSQSVELWERLPAPLPPERAADPLIGQAIMALYSGDFVTAEQIGVRVCERAERWEMAWYLPYAWHIRALAASAQGRMAVAEDAMQRAFAAAEEMGDRRFMAIGHTELGEFAAQRGELEAARQHYQMSWEMHYEFGDREGMADARGKLGELALHSGDYQNAQACFKESRDTFQEIGDRAELAAALDGLGRAATAAGDYEQARAALAQALSLAAEIGLVAQQLAVLVSIGELLQVVRRHERAAEVLQVVLHHSGARHAVQERARAALDNATPTDTSLGDALDQSTFESLVAQLAAELSMPLGIH